MTITRDSLGRLVSETGALLTRKPTPDKGRQEVSEMAKKKAAAKKAAAKRKVAAPQIELKLPNLTSLAVSQKHIDDGDPGDIHTCAVALAVEEVLTEAGIDFEDLAASGGTATFDVSQTVTVPVIANGVEVDEKVLTVYGKVEVNYGAAGDKFMSEFDESDECSSCGNRAHALPKPVKLVGAVSVEITDID